MASGSGDRSAHFPAIEKKYGQPVSFWLERLSDLGEDAKYRAQIALLREDHGFTQTHANALVMFHRGSPSSKRFANPDEYLDHLDETKRRTVHRILHAITTRHPDLELVIAWNQPMLRLDGHDVFGLSSSANHFTLSPWSNAVLQDFAGRLDADPTFTLNKTTFTVPVDWAVDEDLLDAMATARRAEITP